MFSLGEDHALTTMLIAKALPARDVYSQLAEEASELSAAASKMTRKFDSHNPTPKTKEQILDNIAEEIADILDVVSVLVVAGALGADDIFPRMTAKQRRWLTRILTEEQKDA